MWYKSKKRKYIGLELCAAFRSYIVLAKVGFIWDQRLLLQHVVYISRASNISFNIGAQFPFSEGVVIKALYD